MCGSSSCYGVGSAFDMGRELPPPDLALALTPNYLDSTLGIQRRAYWEEINPLLAKWRSINDARCPECAHQSLWMDLTLARRSGQELRNAYTITGSPDFAPLRRFFAAAVDQLQLRYDNMLAQDFTTSMPPTRSLINSMRDDIHQNSALLDNTQTRHSPVEDLAAGELLVDLPSIPVIAPV